MTPEGRPGRPEIDRERMSRLPFVWALGYVAVFGVAFLAISWPFIDTFSQLQRASVGSWREAIADAFGRGVEYRPLFTLAVRVAYETIGTRLWAYEALVLLQFGAILTLVVWLCRPVGLKRALAACVAISCLSGLHTSRILFSFWPLNHDSGGLLLLLLAITLAFHPRARTIDWVLGPLALAALFGIEVGLLILPVIVVLRLVKAPGLSGRGVVWAAVATVAYLAVRLTLTSESGIPSFHNESGFVFSMLDRDAVRARFGDPPVLFWAYNVLATFLTVAASEPRDGVYSFVESLLAHDMESWQWFQVGVSTLTTFVIAAGLMFGRPANARDRLLIATGFALMLFGSGLGFLYVRDRIALSAGVGYVLLLYVALAALLDRLPASRWPRRVVAGALALVSALWVVRSGETYFQLRDIAWDYHLEWTTRYASLGGPSQPATPELARVRDEALNATPADPRLDPAWTYLLFERRFKRSATGG